MHLLYLVVCENLEFPIVDGLFIGMAGPPSDSLTYMAVVDSAGCEEVGIDRHLLGRTMWFLSFSHFSFVAKMFRTSTCLRLICSMNLRNLAL